MLCLAAVLLVLRAGGEQIGWGFQLQSPLFVTLLVYLLLAVGLNLSGVFEVGGGLAGMGDGLTQGDSYRASFFTGVLTTLVATPCTAPFMAFAVGAALTQPPIIALCIFAALGLGLALPYLLLSFAPWMRRALPKTGAWMDTLKQVFAFPIYGVCRVGCSGCLPSRHRPSDWAPRWPAPSSSRWRLGPIKNPSRAPPEAASPRS